MSYTGRPTKKTHGAAFPLNSTTSDAESQERREGEGTADLKTWDMYLPIAKFKALSGYKVSARLLEAELL